MSEQAPRKATVECPDCDHSASFNPRRNAGRIRAKVDLGVHWQDEHEGLIPDDANFGAHQCPSCEDLLGLNGTRSCSECGFIPEVYRDD